MKLKKWADINGVKYLTAYRAFKNGTLPVKAFQTEKGTIIVEDMIEQEISEFNSEQTLSILITKAAEFKENGSTIQEFAAFVIANFNIVFKEKDKEKDVK